MESRLLHYAEEGEMPQENGGGEDDVDGGGDVDDEGGGGDDDDDDENDMNYIRILIGREITGVRLNNEELAVIINDNWYQEVRTHAIPNILRAEQEFRLSRRTLYRAVIYLDKFLASRLIANGELWAMRILTVTCLSLSAKMEESRDNVPPLGSYNTSVNAIRRMEILVLNEFNWKMNCVTPFAFTNFFVSRFCRVVSRIEITRMRTAEFIMSVLTDVRLMNHRPSVIAAAATLLAVNRDFTIEQVEIEINALQPLNGFLHSGNVCYCYYRLREMN